MRGNGIFTISGAMRVGHTVQDKCPRDQLSREGLRVSRTKIAAADRADYHSHMIAIVIVAATGS